MSGRKGFVIENQSPYYHHLSEGPGVVITLTIFYGKYYDLWQKVFRTILRSKNKLRYIEGTLTKPTPKKGEDLSELNAWEIGISMICSWIIGPPTFPIPSKRLARHRSQVLVSSETTCHGTITLSPEGRSNGLCNTIAYKPCTLPLLI